MIARAPSPAVTNVCATSVSSATSYATTIGSSVFRPAGISTCVPRSSRVTETAGAMTLSDATGDLFANGVVAFALHALGEIRTAGLHDPSVHHDVHDIGRNVAQNARIVGDDQEAGVFAVVGGAHRFDRLADRLQRVDVEAGIGLIEHGVLRGEDGELQHLEPLFFAARETVVDVAREKGRVHVEDAELFID